MIAIHTRIRPLIYPFTAYDSPVWRIRLTNEHRDPLGTITEIIINKIIYTRVNSYEVLRTTERAFYVENLNPIRVLVHFDKHDPPYVFNDFEFRENYSTEAIINNLITGKEGDYIVHEDANLITFRERT